MEALKRLAGEAAAARVRSGQRLGLGTGSTVRFFLEKLAERLRAGELADVAGVPTSKRTEALARRLGIPLITLDACPRLDLAVDGADEIAPDLNLIKGLGGALLREKIVAASAERFLVIADESKRVARLGARAPVPVEVLPFGLAPTLRALAALGAEPALRRVAGKPYRTDQGNVILDCAFGPLDAPHELARRLDALPAVLGHGLFLDLAHEALVGSSQGLLTLKPPTSP